ncbi:MAG: hypothetical protein HYZ21_00625 [Chloroflexi bacterium]|nr:hypothetical protein [Chloroflexota bacterium]
MNPRDKYVKLVEWSEEDQCFIGSCPELFHGGCHGEDPVLVFEELCEIVEETLSIYEEDGIPFPEPLSGKDFVNAMHKIV